MSDTASVPDKDSINAGGAAPIQPQNSIEPLMQPGRISGSATMSIGEIARELKLTPVERGDWSPEYLEVMTRLNRSPVELPPTYSNSDWDAIARYPAPLRGPDGQPLLGKDEKPIADPLFRVRVPMAALTGMESAANTLFDFIPAYRLMGMSLSADTNGAIIPGAALTPLAELPFLKPERMPALLKLSRVKDLPSFVPPEIGEPTGSVTIIDGTRDERPFFEALPESAPGSETHKSPLILNGSADDRPYRISVVAPPKPVSLEPEPSRREQIWSHLRALAEIVVPARRPRNDEPAAENEPQAEEPAVPNDAAEFSAAVPRIVEAPLGAFESGAKLVVSAALPAAKPQKLSIVEVDPREAAKSNPQPNPAAEVRTAGLSLVRSRESQAPETPPLFPEGAPTPVVTEIRSASAAITPPTAVPAQSLAPLSGKEAERRAAVAALITRSGTAKPAASAAQAAPRSHGNGEVDWDPQATPTLGKRIGAFVAGLRGRETTPRAAAQSQLNS